MKFLRLTIAALLAAACNGEKAPDPAPVATPAAPVYQQSWFTGGDAAPSLELHETQYGLHGRLVDPLGKSYPVRAISRTETGLTFTAPSLDAVFNATPWAETLFEPGTGDRQFFNLKRYCSGRLARTGVAHIDALADDTLSQPDAYFSHRHAVKAGERDCGRNMTGIMLLG